MDEIKLAHVHQHLKYLTVDGDSFILPEKAYKNIAWLNSSGAKPVRILCEFLEPEQRFAAAHVKNTILFFGSARARCEEEHTHAVARAERVKADPSSSEPARLQASATLERLSRTAWMTTVYSQVEALARKLTEWSMGRIDAEGRIPYIISTGGGPGLMEAANKGAASVPGALTAGIAISLPFEAGLNKYVTPELGFQMHYFFSRKFALCWPSRALIACPGGYGTLDELMEVLTLLQSGKIEHPDTMPVVLFGGAYWRTVVNWDALEAHGTINRADIDRLFFTDDVDAAFNYIVEKLSAWEMAAAAAALKSAEAAHSAAVSAAAAAYAAAAKAAQLAAAQHMTPHADAFTAAPSALRASGGAAAAASPFVMPGRTPASMTVVPNNAAYARGAPRTDMSAAATPVDAEAAPHEAPDAVLLARLKSPARARDMAEE